MTLEQFYQKYGTDGAQSLLAISNQILVCNPTGAQASKANATLAQVYSDIHLLMSDYAKQRETTNKQ
jgi:hypothetical protein